MEACEYKQAFLDYRPEMIVITNIEEEHLDCYKNLAQIKQIFLKFIGNLAPNGKLIVCSQSESAVAVAKRSKRKFYTYGEKKSDDFMVKKDLDLKVFGAHNLFNATAAIAVGSLLGLKPEKSAAILEKFQGIKRRSEYLGRKDSVMVYDDYAHHPTEIRATVRAFKDNFRNKRIILVFQPHQRSRLNALFDRFVSSLVIADRVIILPAFEPPGRERSTGRDSIDLSISLKEAGVRADFCESFSQAAQLLDQINEPGDIVLTMGAGPVNRVAKRYLNQY